MLLSSASCSGDSRDSDAFEKYVADHKVGGDADQWIEMRNSVGEWERTGLIFGYIGDHEECQKAIAGLKKVNFAREYRCTPANE